MKNKFLVLMFCVLQIGMTNASEIVEQVKLQVQKTEARVDKLEGASTKAVRDVSSLKRKVSELSSAQRVQQQVSGDISAKLNLFEAQQRVLKDKLDLLEGKQSSLGTGIEQLTQNTEQKTQTINQVITSRSQWYGGAIFVVLCLFAGGYWYLSRRNQVSEQSLNAQVQRVIETVRSSEEKVAKADTALADSLFEILNKLKLQEIAASTSSQNDTLEPNHNLPLKLADEINRMRKRLASLPEETKGLTPLKKSLERLEVELADQGYEIVEHTGMTYTENLSVKARFIPSDELGQDQRVITKVVTPQVNYKGVLIRMADIEVSIGS